MLLSLVKASTRLERVQAAFLEQLAVSLHCADALDLLAPLCLRLITKERLGTMEVRTLLLRHLSLPPVLWIRIRIDLARLDPDPYWGMQIRITKQGNLPR